MKKVVVTGGAGFIGSHLAEELTRQGCHVVIIDNLATGRLENIAHLRDSQNVEFIKDTILNLPRLKQLFNNAEYIFHEAALPSVPRSIANPQASHEVNVTGTLNVLFAAKENSIKKVVYASSSAVYGDMPTLPKREDMTPNPLSPYAVGKLAAEYYCLVFHQVYGLPTVCLRYFNVFGPRQDPDSPYAAVIPRFIKSVFEGNPPVIFDDGEQSRDFAYVRDVVAASILAAESGASGLFNVARGKSITINELAKLVITITGKKIAPVYREPRPGDVKHSLADISRAKSFGYEPKYSLEEGLKETIRSFQNGFQSGEKP